MARGPIAYVIHHLRQQDAGRYGPWNLANQMSYIRPVLLILAIISFEIEYNLLGGLLVVASLASDWLDGYIAKHHGRQSTLGELLDPMFDKLTLLIAIIWFYARGDISRWLILAAIVVELLIAIVSTIAHTRTSVSGTHITAKSGILFRSLALALALADAEMTALNDTLALQAALFALGTLLGLIGMVEYYMRKTSQKV